jgi:hypothetical protein
MTIEEKDRLFQILDRLKKQTEVLKDLVAARVDACLEFGPGEVVNKTVIVYCITSQ